MARTYHIVPHTHWDREWYRTFQEFRIRLVRLMDRLLDILERDDEYAHFMLDGQTLLLDDYLEIRPEREAEIARWVGEGRLSIGPWAVLADEFLVAPESLVRNLMLGDRMCRRFGGKMPVGYVPDLFGHIAQLPQILKGFDLDSAVLRRGLADDPVELWWEAPDGSRVLTCYLRDGYDNASRLPMGDADAFAAAVQSAAHHLAPHVQSGHMLLMAGNDHQEPDPRLSDLIAAAGDGRLSEDKLVHSSLEGYVSAVREAVEGSSLPTVEEELRSPERHHLLPGVLSARMWIKQRNDAVETLLTRWTEPFTAWSQLLDSGGVPAAETHAHLSGHEPLADIRQPQPFIRKAWRILLENHPHDSICGCSVDQIHKEMDVRFDEAEQIAGAIASLSLSAIADRVATDRLSESAASGDSTQPVIVFNPTGGPRTDVVTARLYLAEAVEGVEVIAPDGRVCPHQIAAESVGTEQVLFQQEATPEEMASYLAMVRGGRLLNYSIHQVRVRPRAQDVDVLVTVGKRGTPNREQVSMAEAQIRALIARGDVSRFVVRAVIAEPTDVTFLAPELPSHGYATFAVRSKEGREGASGGGIGEVSDDLALENDRFVLRVDPSYGTLTLVDKAADTVYLGLNRFVDGGDRGDEYNYCRPEQDELVTRPMGRPDIRMVESGPVCQTVEIAQVYHLPSSLGSDRKRRSETGVDVPIVSRVRLLAGVPRVEIETTVDNRARDHRLRVHFPVPVRVDHGHTKGHFHVVRRPIPPVPDGLDTDGWIEQPASTVPQRGWADVGDGEVGLMIANRGLPEVEFIPEGESTTIALTLLRCVGWLSRDDIHCREGRAGSLLPTPGAQCLGRHIFHYALIPHSGGWEEARGEAEAFHAPPRTLAAEVQSGPLPPTGSLVEVEPSSFVVTAIKQPEEEERGPGLVVRGVNLSGRPIDVRLRPCQPFDRASMTNLNERPVVDLPMEKDGTVAFSAGPWEIKTVRWTADEG